MLLIIHRERTPSLQEPNIHISFELFFLSTTKSQQNSLLVPSTPNLNQICLLVTQNSQTRPASNDGPSTKGAPLELLAAAALVSAPEPPVYFSLSSSPMPYWFFKP